ncbi:MAG: esterase-like activity of phytase family protein [Kangiellaceae bacterium]
MKLAVKPSIVCICIFLSNYTFSQTEMSTLAISLPPTHSSLQIVHSDRHHTGGFSTLSFSSDCSTLTTISDYSQAANSQLDQAVRRSGWYQAKVEFNTDDTLKSLNFNSKGQLKNLKGEILQGATESMAKESNGYLVSFDDRGTIYRYHASNKEPIALNNIPTIAFQQSNLGDGNLGLESIALLDKEHLLALWETKKDESKAVGRLLSRDGKIKDINYFAGASPGGLAKLSNGNLLVLEKRWLGAKGQRLRLVELDKSIFTSIKNSESPSTIHGKVLLDSVEVEYDNNEGISSCVRNGKEWIFVITDDNGDWPSRNVEDKGYKRQRTLLMQFDLEQLRSRSKSSVIRSSQNN